MTTQGKDNSMGIFFKIPPELRQGIYRFLLVNPILSTRNSVAKDYTPEFQLRHGILVRYGLCPQILRTCRQIYHEASDILYGSNRFSITAGGAGLYGSNRIHYLYISPITRYARGDLNQLFAEHFSTLAKVRHWKAFIDPIPGIFENSLGLSYLCQTIRHTPPKSLEIHIVDRGLYDRSIDNSVYSIADLIRPLRMLRNIGRLDFLVEKTNDVLARASYNILPARSIAQQLELDLEAEISLLVTSNAPAENGYKMYNDLLSYCRTFERYRPYKIAMGRLFPALSEGPLLHERRESFSGELDEDIVYGLESAIISNPRTILPGQLSKPFIVPSLCRDSIWPVESGLARARMAIETYKMSDFKRHRSDVMHYLEPQFLRMATAAQTLVKSIGVWMQEGGFLDPRSIQSIWINSRTAAEAVLVLEDFAKACQRDLSPALRVEVRANQRSWESHYSFQDREISLEQLSKALEQQDYHNFTALFIVVAEDLMGQYSNMCTAREALYNGDIPGEHGCDIELEVDVEKIDWEWIRQISRTATILRDRFMMWSNQPS